MLKGIQNYKQNFILESDASYRLSKINLTNVRNMNNAIVQHFKLSKRLDNSLVFFYACWIDIFYMKESILVRGCYPGRQ